MRTDMNTHLIRYDLLVQDAMRGVVRKVLGEVAALGELPGEHHFTITFRTDAPGVKISRRLAEQWPLEMTIILQHQYSGLAVDDLGFAVTLSFRSVPESLYVPYEAVTMFSDPSVEFGLKFNVEDDREEVEAAPVRRPGPSLVRPEQPVEASAPAPAPAKIDSAPPEPPAAPPRGAGDKIVSIDAFRKKT
jgi:hypothetical protein